MNNNANNPGSLDRNEFLADPVRALYEALLELIDIYEAVGVPRDAARSAALADFECDFAVLPLEKPEGELGALALAA